MVDVLVLVVDVDVESLVDIEEASLELELELELELMVGSSEPVDEDDGDGVALEDVSAVVLGVTIRSLEACVSVDELNVVVSSVVNGKEEASVFELESSVESIEVVTTFEAEIDLDRVADTSEATPEVRKDSDAEVGAEMVVIDEDDDKNVDEDSDAEVVAEIVVLDEDEDKKEPVVMAIDVEVVSDHVNVSWRVVDEIT